MAPSARTLAPVSPRLWRWAWIAVDALAAAAVMTAVVLMRPASGWWVWCLAGLLGLPLAVRRWWPVPVLVVVLLATAAALIVGIGIEIVVYVVAVALYPVALSSVRAAAWGLAAALGGVLVPGLVDAFVAGLPIVPARENVESFSTTPVTVTGYGTAVIAASWVLAWAVRTRQRHTGQLTDLRVARAIAEERLRIARDVHDVVGHTLSLITMQAAVANHLGTGREAALRTIEQAGRSALDDVRTVLGGLREQGGARENGGPPSLTDLDRLVEETRAAGVAVTVDRADLSRVPAGVRTSAYRIVQEALTNVRRHARAARCRVTVAVTDDGLSLAVVDDGTTTHRTDPSGYGLLGMRERAALHRGSLSAGPEADGGFAVRATLPFRT
ncbi:sensor histidine kinase [Micromonospora sp. NPDC050187]|uniref:sensor histidine kinase n=1 Tax=Micromonospora sp. NPDC050187 TaxID=3364277 RepID=UPI0037B15F97